MQEADLPNVRYGCLPVPRADDSVSLVLIWLEKSATKEIRELDRQR